MNDEPVDFSLIKFIDFSVFQELEEFPRLPDLDLTCTLDTIDRDNSLLVFISHCWSRPNKEVAGSSWNARAHPDDADGGKFKLCVSGIERLWKRMAPKMNNCYVWLDFGCVDQDNRKDLPKSLKRYDKIVGICDALFTPIINVDDDWIVAQANDDVWNGFTAVNAIGGSNHYLNRAWCRMEMMYAANIAVVDNCDGTLRHLKFDLGLAHHCKHNRRPHFLYSLVEEEKGLSPHATPPLQNSFFENHSPLLGNITVPSDLTIIQGFVDSFMPVLAAAAATIGYEGSRNELGEKHGIGRETFALGTVYEGEWKHDVCDGWGVVNFGEGSRYEGEFKSGMKEGQGVFYLANGDVYEGCFAKGLPEGQGTLRYLNGGVYEGEWRQGKKHGSGMMQYLHSVDEGSGYKKGTIYFGGFKDDCFDGFGTLQEPEGVIYSGEWRSNKPYFGGEVQPTDVQPQAATLLVLDSDDDDSEYVGSDDD